MGETLHYQYMKLKQYATHPDTYAGFVDIKKIYWKNFAKNGKNITQIFVDLCQSLTMNNTTEKCLFGEDTQINIVSTACRDMLSTMSLETITKITPLWMDDL